MYAPLHVHNANHMSAPPRANWHIHTAMYLTHAARYNPVHTANAQLQPLTQLGWLKDCMVAATVFNAVPRCNNLWRQQMQWEQSWCIAIKASCPTSASFAWGAWPLWKWPKPCATWYAPLLFRCFCFCHIPSVVHTIANGIHRANCQVLQSGNLEVHPRYAVVHALSAAMNFTVHGMTQEIRNA